MLARRFVGRYAVVSRAFPWRHRASEVVAVRDVAASLAAAVRVILVLRAAVIATWPPESPRPNWWPSLKPPSMFELIAADVSTQYSPLVAYAFTVNYILDVGSLGIPYAFFRTGLVMSNLMIVLVTLISYMMVMWVSETVARAREAYVISYINETTPLNESDAKAAELRYDDFPEVTQLCDSFLGKLVIAAGAHVRRLARLLAGVCQQLPDAGDEHRRHRDHESPRGATLWLDRDPAVMLGPDGADLRAARDVDRALWRAAHHDRECVLRHRVQARGPLGLRRHVQHGRVLTVVPALGAWAARTAGHAEPGEVAHDLRQHARDDDAALHRVRLDLLAVLRPQGRVEHQLELGRLHVGSRGVGVASAALDQDHVDNRGHLPRARHTQRVPADLGHARRQYGGGRTAPLGECIRQQTVLETRVPVRGIDPAAARLGVCLGPVDHASVQRHVENLRRVLRAGVAAAVRESRAPELERVLRRIQQRQVRLCRARVRCAALPADSAARGMNASEQGWLI